MWVYVPAHRWKSAFKERSGWHGWQMPEPLLGRIIRACSDPGDLVLDPFGGSGTTLVVAKKLNRRFLGFELSPDYAAAIRKRLDAARPGQSLEGSPEPTAGGKGRRLRSPRRVERICPRPLAVQYGDVEWLRPRGSPRADDVSKWNDDHELAAGVPADRRGGRAEGRVARVEDILIILEERFGPRARELEPRLKQVEDEWLRGLLQYAVVKCPNLEAFRMRI